MGDSQDRSDGIASPGADGSGSVVLTDRYRRQAYRHLRGTDGPVSVATLARAVVARTAGKSPDAVTLDEQKRMYTALDRAHLPELETVGLVERDHAQDTVALRTGVAEFVEDRSGDVNDGPGSADAAGPTDDRSETTADAASEPGC